MRVWFISDLHLRLKDAMDLIKPRTIPDADVCVVAGDVCDSMHLAVNWLGKVIRPHMPVVFVPGNHEFYDTSIVTGRKDAAMIAKALDVTLLDDAEVVIDGIRFIGGTLWTDYRLFEERGLSIRDAMFAARHGLADFNNIYLDGTVVDGVMPRLVRPHELQKLHCKTVDFIKDRLAASGEEETIVVTHHAPHVNSVAEQYIGDDTSAAYASDLSHVIEEYRPSMWIHGHTHTVFDYVVGETRIVCNPKGPNIGIPAFNWSKTLEIGGNNHNLERNR